MKILWISHICPFPPKGGVNQRSYYLLKELSERNEVSFVGFNQLGQLKTGSQIETAKAEFARLCKKVAIIPIPCEKFRWGKLLLAIKCFFCFSSYTVEWLRSDEMVHALKKINSEDDFDLVYFDTISLAIYEKIFGNKKRILNHHNVESDMMLRRSRKEKNLFKKVYFSFEYLKIKHFEKTYCPKFDYNIVCSDLDGKRLCKIVQSLNIEVIPNGVDIDYFKSNQLLKKKNSLIFVGGMSWYPNRQAVLYFINKIWPILKKEIPDITVTIIGKAPPEKLVQISKTDNRFIVPGFVDDIREYIDSAFVYICPIMDGGGTKLKILDALAMEKAIVAHPIACEGIMVQDKESVLLAESPLQFVNCIRSLFNDSELRNNLGKNGRMLVERLYSFKNIGEKLHLLCQTIINK